MKYNIKDYNIIVEKGRKGGLRYSYYKDDMLIYRKTIRKYHDIKKELLDGIIYANAQILSLDDIINDNYSDKASLDSILRAVRDSNIDITYKRIKSDSDFWGYYTNYIIFVNGYSDGKEYYNLKEGIVNSIKKFVINGEKQNKEK